MGLFGRRQNKAAPAQAADHLSAIVEALPLLQEKLEMTPTGRAAVCLRPDSARPGGRGKRVKKPNKGQPEVGADMSFQSDINSLLSDALMGGTETSTVSFKTSQDSYGYLWVVLRGLELSSMAAAVGRVARVLQEKGHGERLALAVFPFRQGQREVFWMYSFARKRFYPFAPLEEPKRDGPLELNMAGVAEKVLPIEGQLERWHALWGIPLS
ncbi:MAG: hypothetical protein EXR48_05450 [Dehalococcoidia bacterium]|nr:hypothetical protein [Dehalococcoidia bacterium]